MVYGIPEPGSYFRVPDDDIPDPFTCEGCGEEFEVSDMADPDRHGGMGICVWCEEDWR